MGLGKYHSKRKFTETSEPKGKVSKSGGALKFVIQKHDATRLHYDFRLELDGVLKSWAVPKGPSMNPADKRLAMMVEDHPYDYKDFEGTIPEGNYGAGTVMLWDEGTYHALETKDPKESAKILRAGLAKGEIKFFLEGEKLTGGFVLVKLRGSYGGKKNENSWLLIKEKDEHVLKADITKQDTSVRTESTMEEIAGGSGKTWKSNRKAKGEQSKPEPAKTDRAKATAPVSGKKSAMPHHVKPMLATLVDEAFDREDWIFEIKWDGFRGLAEVKKRKVELYSRNLLSFNEQYAPIVKELKELDCDAVFDGEIVCLDAKGKSSFQLLQNFNNTGKGNLVYYVFDLLYYNGYDLREQQLLKRKELLKSVLPSSGRIRYSDHVETDGIEFFKAAQKQGLEGIIGKNGESEYKTARRSSDWVKIKTHMRQEAVIAGFTKPRGSREKFGALVLGVYEGDELKYIGHTGSGFNDKSLKDMHEKLMRLVTKDSPFEKIPKTNAPVTWVKPKLVCEISFAEWTSDGSMRQPIFQGLRLDKKASEVIKEKPVDMSKTKSFAKAAPSSKETHLKISGKDVKVTHLDKVYWPKEKYTKGDLIEYYRKMAHVMLPYLKDRPENMNRHPNGIDGPSFYQKDVEDHPSWIKTKKVFSESNNKDIHYLICNDEATLVYMANLGCIEINPWNSTASNIDNPDYAIIDLDPEDIGFDKVVEVAQVTHKILEKYGIDSYCKTSGATGLHIFIPLAGKYDYDLVRQFAQVLVTMVNQELPKITSLERSPKKRQKKIYLDYLQNRHGQTLAAPYSVRPKPGATVSTPLEWKEVNKKLKPTDFNIKNIFKRLEKKGDLWKPVLGKGVDIEKAIKKMTK
jgi:bifunctional non-homologous end joining protein LigD